MAEIPEFDDVPLWELSALREAALQETDKLQSICDEVETALGRIAREHYPALKEWEPAELRQLGDLIARHAGRFARELSQLDAEPR
ncbi:MAG TPA: hypothetical protein VGD81_13665 [Opitutaceae bacterium]